MFGFSGPFWVLLCCYFLRLIGCIFGIFHRFVADEKQHGNHTGLDHFEDSKSGAFDEKKEDPVFMENASTPSSTVSKCQFLSEKDFSGFVEEPKTMSFTVRELYIDSISRNNQVLDIISLGGKGFWELNFQAEATKQYFEGFELKTEDIKPVEADDSTGEELRAIKPGEEVINQVVREDSANKKIQEFVFDSETFIIQEIAEHSARKDLQDSDFETKLINEVKAQNPDELGDKTEDLDDGYIELEPLFQNFNVPCEEKENLGTSQDFSGVEEKHEGLQNTKNQQKDDSENLGSTEKSRVVDSDDDVGFEILREHRDLIEHLKLELKRVKNSRLPTILEESESPKMVDDLKPLKINDKLEHKDQIQEIQKLYKSYAEKMRKLDILNDQTLHALEFLQLKDQVCRKPFVTTIKSLAQNFQQCKSDSEADPTLKFIRNLEIVYVGQLCLSWEILHWQYRKAREMQEYNPQGFRQYNHVADEFQQFQVLLQRFIENEVFQGPRVENYTKSRSVLRGLLQVPAIRDDCLKDKKEMREKVEEVISISIAKLTETIMESMRIFWEFLRADKDDTNSILRSSRRTCLELIKPANLRALVDVQKKLHKQDRRLKEQVRSGNCIVKKFQKHQEDRVGGSVFIAQVETRLVLRVLDMSRLTADQLRWCSEKQSNISFVNRKIQVEPSFLIFPC